MLMPSAFFVDDRLRPGCSKKGVLNAEIALRAISAFNRKTSTRAAGASTPSDNKSVVTVGIFSVGKGISYSHKSWKNSLAQKNLPIL
jgi:hypothetical protein